VKIEIDDALLARNQELLTKIIEYRENGQIGSQVENEAWMEIHSVTQKIIDITTTAYYKRGEEQ